MPSTSDWGRIFGCTIHSFTFLRMPHSPSACDGAHPNVIVLAAGGESVRLVCELLLQRRTRLLERHGLEVACRYRLAVMPTNFQRADAHRILARQFEASKRARYASVEEESVVKNSSGWEPELVILTVPLISAARSYLINQPFVLW